MQTNVETTWVIQPGGPRGSFIGPSLPAGVASWTDTSDIDAPKPGDVSTGDAIVMSTKVLDDAKSAGLISDWSPDV